MKTKIFKSEEEKSEWHSWFAWRPVLQDGVLYWLVNLERMRLGPRRGYYFWVYREFKNENKS